MKTGKSLETVKQSLKKKGNLMEEKALKKVNKSAK